MTGRSSLAAVWVGIAVLANGQTTARKPEFDAAVVKPVQKGTAGGR